MISLYGSVPKDLAGAYDKSVLEELQQMMGGMLPGTNKTYPLNESMERIAKHRDRR